MKSEIKKLPELIAFTWAPNSTYHTNDPNIGYQMSILILRRLRLCCKALQIFPELTNAGHIHYHGKLWIKDYVKWYKSVLPTLKRNGFVKIKPNPNEGWDEYCNKQWDIFKEVLDLDNPIDITYLSKIKKLKDDVKYSQNIIDITWYSRKPVDNYVVDDLRVRSKSRRPHE